MTQKKKAAVAARVVAKPVTAVKPPKKLIPRLAPKAELMPEISVSEVPPVATPVIVPAAVVEATAAATAKVRPPRKPSKEDETVARHQKVLAEALEMAQAIKYDQPKMMRPEVTKETAKETTKEKKGAKPVKPKKPKLVRDSYAMPEVEYAQIAELKKRLLAQGTAVKKNELLRGGIAALAALTDAELKAVMAGVERIKTGRPAK